MRWTKSSAVYAFNFAISNQEVLADLLLPCCSSLCLELPPGPGESGFELQAVEQVGAPGLRPSQAPLRGGGSFPGSGGGHVLFLAGLYAMGMETLPGYPPNNNQYYAIASAGHVGLFYLVGLPLRG